MKNGCAIAFIVVILSFVGIIFGFNWWVKSAFGPTYKTFSISLDKGYTLLCKQTYSADLAAVFYDVDFQLTANSIDTLELGSATFSNENWHDNLYLKIIGDWFVLPVNTGSYSKLL